MWDRELSSRAGGGRPGVCSVFSNKHQTPAPGRPRAATYGSLRSVPDCPSTWELLLDTLIVTLRLFLVLCVVSMIVLIDLIIFFNVGTMHG